MIGHKFNLNESTHYLALQGAYKSEVERTMSLTTSLHSTNVDSQLVLLEEFPVIRKIIAAMARLP